MTKEEPEKILSVLEDVEAHTRTILGEADPGLRISMTEAEPVERVMSDNDVSAIAEGLVLLHSGIFQMSFVTPGLVETSSNLGMLKTEEKSVWFSYYPRSSVDKKLSDIAEGCRILGNRLGLEVRADEAPSPGWRERSESVLADTMTKIFEEQNGFPMKVSVIHAGLECGWHIWKAPHLDMASVGATNHDIHSPKERLELATVPPQIRLVMQTLQRLAEK